MLDGWASKLWAIYWVVSNGQPLLDLNTYLHRRLLVVAKTIRHGMVQHSR